MNELENKILNENTEPKFTCTDLEEWNKYIDSNKEPYGRAICVFANYWAKYMEELIADKFEDLSKEQIDECGRKADDYAGGITGFMYGAAISMLRDTWKYGKDLNKWHNKSYGVEDSEGTVNPAIITVGEKQ